MICPEKQNNDKIKSNRKNCVTKERKKIFRILLTFNAFSIPGMSDPMWSARQLGKTTTSSFKTEKAPTCIDNYDQNLETLMDINF